MSFRSHYLPRSHQGWIAVLAFLGLMALAQPPIASSSKLIASWHEGNSGCRQVMADRRRFTASGKAH